MDTLSIKLNEIIKNANESISILVKKIDDNHSLYAHQSDEQRISASTIKVPIMLAMLEEVRLGHIQLSDTLCVSNDKILEDSDIFKDREGYYTVEELITWMIILSENSATNILINYLGIDKINTYIQDILQVHHTKVERVMLDFEAVKKGLNNYISQNDMYEILRKLYRHEILDDTLCQCAIDIMKNQRWKNQIMRFICEPIPYAHKTGDLDYLHHDMGVMTIHDQDYYVGVSILSKDNIKGNYPLIGTIGKIIVEYLKTL